MSKRWLDNEIITLLDKLGRRICRKFGYRYKAFKAMHPNDALYTGYVGWCDCENKVIAIKTRRCKNKFYTIHFLVDTLIHEIAHLKDKATDPEHSQEWRERYLELKEWVETHLYG